MKTDLDFSKDLFKWPDPIMEGGLRTKKIVKNYDKSKPLISIITAVYNGENYLQECLDSLHRQKNLNYEHIIIDGQSKDKTIEIGIELSPISSFKKMQKVNLVIGKIQMKMLIAYEQNYFYRPSATKKI